MELSQLYDRGVKGSVQKSTLCHLFVIAGGYVPIYPGQRILLGRPYSDRNDGLKRYCCRMFHSN